MIEVPESVRPYFLAAGWFPDRRVAVSPTVPADHPAAEILGFFGGLVVSRPEDDEGEECGLDDLAFRELYRDPSVLDVWTGLVGSRLVGVADVHQGLGEWYVAADGRVFGRSCVHDAFWLAGLSFAEAAERSLLGRRVRPMLRPDQMTVNLYGQRFTRESPEVYHYGPDGLRP